MPSQIWLSIIHRNIFIILKYERVSDQNLQLPEN